MIRLFQTRRTDVSAKGWSYALSKYGTRRGEDIGGQWIEQGEASHYESLVQSSLPDLLFQKGQVFPRKTDYIPVLKTVRARLDLTVL